MVTDLRNNKMWVISPGLCKLLSADFFMFQDLFFWKYWSTDKGIYGKYP